MSAWLTYKMMRDNHVRNGGDGDEFDAQYGCAIAIVLGVILVGVLCWTGWNAFRDASSPVIFDGPVQVTVLSVEDNQQTSKYRRCTLVVQPVAAVQPTGFGPLPATLPPYTISLSASNGCSDTALGLPGNSWLATVTYRDEWGSGQEFYYSRFDLSNEEQLRAP